MKTLQKKENPTLSFKDLESTEIVPVITSNGKLIETELETVLQTCQDIPGLDKHSGSDSMYEKMLFNEAHFDITTNELKHIQSDLPISFHPSYHLVYKKLHKWLTRFSDSTDPSIFHDLLLFYLLSTKKFLDHRNSSHLFRLVFLINRVHKKLLAATTLFPHRRHLEVRLLPTSLVFPFSSKPVLGCLIGFNILDRNELFDEENVLLALQKHLPELRLVKDSIYSHASQYLDQKIFYLEIEKKDGTTFSSSERKLLKTRLDEKVKYSIQKLAPPVFAKSNQEELYKNILVLSQEIECLEDLPQASISLDHQTGKEIVFSVTLVYISLFHHFHLKEYFTDCLFVSEHVTIVKYIQENHPVEAYIFRLHLPRDASLVRTDGSFDFYAARRKVSDLIKSAIGEFRDFNGGLIIKQQELLQELKASYPEINAQNPDLIDSFFYALIPLQKQAVLQKEIISALFNYYLQNRNEKLPESSPYSFKIHHQKSLTFVTVRGEDSSLITTISAILQGPSFQTVDFAYNFLNTLDGVFFNCVFLKADSLDAQSCLEALRQSLDCWCDKMNNRQILRIGFEVTVVSLDPRIGGDDHSSEVLKLLFEGLTRLNPLGQIENGAAESIEISANSKQYTFKLRPSFWNDGSPVTAFDFEYAWKKILSPDFKTAFAYLFYPIKNAREAKEGKVGPEAIGIHAIDDRTLKVELNFATPYFLQCTALTLFSPIRRLIDQQYPQWPYQCEKQYPCNGPFQLRVNHPNQGYQLIKNPHYWEASQITLEQISMTRMNSLEAFQLLQKKELDWVGHPFGWWNPTYNSGSEGRIVSSPNALVSWCVFNSSCAPFNHPKLRQAFAYAINRDEFVSNPFFPLTPAYSVLLPHYRKQSYPFFPEMNVEYAKKLFHEALEELGISLKDFPPLPLIFLEEGIREHIAFCLKRQFEQTLGVVCHLKPLPWNMLFNKLTMGSYHIGLFHWSPWINDPIYTLGGFRFEEDSNFAKWEHHEFDRLIELSEQEGNPFQRSTYLLKAEEILSKEMPIIPLYYQPYQALVQKDLHVNYIPCGSVNIARGFYKKGALK